MHEKVGQLCCEDFSSGVCAADPLTPLSPSSHHRHTTTVVSVPQPGNKWREKSGSDSLDVDEDLGALGGDQPLLSSAPRLSSLRAPPAQMVIERSIKMDPVDFIASLGCLFGLCLGFSIVSFIEIVYWAVAGHIRNMFLRKKQQM